MNTLPDYIHHFSWVTRVSLELPIGFEEESNDPDTGSVIYANDLDDEDEPGARVLVKATGIPEGVDDAHLQMLAQSAQLVGSGSAEVHTFDLDGYPAATQRVSYHQAEIDADVVRTECCVQVETVLFSVVCLAFAEDAENYAAPFDHALRTMRFVLPDDPGVELLVSARVPQSWEATRIESVADDEQAATAIGVRYFAEPVAELDGYRPTLSIACGEPDGAGDEWFERFCEQRRARMDSQYEGFSLVRHDRFPLSSLCPVDAIWFEWQADPDMRFMQVQALVYADRYRMYVINAASRVECAENVRSVFDHVIQTLRILPSNTEG